MPSNCSIPRSVLVCFAVREEAKFFAPPPKSAIRVETLVTGMGAKNAVRALEHALQHSSPEMVWTCGFAGGLEPKLPRGTVVFSADEGDFAGSNLPKVGAIRAKFYFAERIVTTASEKQALRTRTHADAVEMESEVIRRICAQRQIRSATVRVISDAAADDLPVDFNRLLTERFEISYAKLAWMLLCHPSKIRGLLQLQRQTLQAASALAGVLHRLLDSAH